MSMRRHDNPRLPSFRGEALPWLGGDLQTIRARITSDYPRLPEGEAVTLSLEDGDAMTATLHAPQAARDPRQNSGGGASIILVHGLTGCIESHYILQCAKHALEAGMAVLRVNMRGAGASAPLAKKRYSAKSGADLVPFIKFMKDRFPHQPCFMAAYSIGGTAALNMLLDCTEQIKGLDGLATIAAPLDLHETSRRFHRLRNKPYMLYILRRLKHMASAMPSLDETQKHAISKLRSIKAFDDLMTAPMMGFDSADAYYTAASTQGRLDHPAVPLLMLYADNDPWVHVGAGFESNSTVLIARGGGHVGFFDDQGPWVPRVILAWMAQHLNMSMHNMGMHGAAR